MLKAVESRLGFMVYQSGQDEIRFGIILYLLHDYRKTVGERKRIAEAISRFLDRIPMTSLLHCEILAYWRENTGTAGTILTNDLTAPISTDPRMTAARRRLIWRFIGESVGISLTRLCTIPVSA